MSVAERLPESQLPLDPEGQALELDEAAEGRVLEQLAVQLQSPGVSGRLPAVDRASATTRRGPPPLSSLGLHLRDHGGSSPRSPGLFEWAWKFLKGDPGSPWQNPRSALTGRR